MAHHKRRRPKSRRAGCLLCKPHKANGLKGCAHMMAPRDRRTRDQMDAQVRELRDAA